jgi:hypothetical protein
LRLQAKADSWVAQLLGVHITAGDSSNNIEITSDYTNVAKWADLKITYKK